MPRQWHKTETLSIVRLVYRAGFALEVAAITDMSASTVRDCTDRAKRQLRATLEEAEDGRACE
jgi:DNA-directed RNA polymerase specialized sigma24 family protein